MATPTAGLAFPTGAGTLAHPGLAVLRRGGFAAFFSHPARVALAVVTLVLTGVALLGLMSLLQHAYAQRRPIRPPIEIPGGQPPGQPGQKKEAYDLGRLTLPKDDDLKERLDAAEAGGQREGHGGEEMRAIQRREGQLVADGGPGALGRERHPKPHRLKKSQGIRQHQRCGIEQRHKAQAHDAGGWTKAWRLEVRGERQAGFRTSGGPSWAAQKEEGLARDAPLHPALSVWISTTQR